LGTWVLCAQLKSFRLNLDALSGQQQGSASLLELLELGG